MRKPFTCDHPEGERTLCKRVNAGGGVMVSWQCHTCGRRIGNWLSLERVPKWKDLPEWDYAIEPAYELSEKQYMLKYRAWRVEQEGVSAFATGPQVQVGARFWEKYADYLRSDVWREKRALVFSRAHNICEGCGKAPATQAHHLNYHRVGREMLFDLVAVCEACHESIHDKERR